MRARLHTMSFVCALPRNRIRNRSLYRVFEFLPAAVSPHHRSAIVRAVTSHFKFANMLHESPLTAWTSRHRGYNFHARAASYLTSSETEPQALLPHYLTTTTTLPTYHTLTTLAWSESPNQDISLFEYLNYITSSSLSIARSDLLTQHFRNNEQKLPQQVEQREPDK